MNNELTNRIDLMSDEELIDDLSLYIAEYTEEARKMLWEEFRNRGLDEKLIEERKSKHIEEIENIKKREEQDIMVVKNFPSRLYAEQAQEILNNENIWAVVSGTDIAFGPGVGFGTMTPDGGGVSLCVLEEDYNRAKSLIESFFDHI